MPAHAKLCPFGKSFNQQGEREAGMKLSASIVLLLALVLQTPLAGAGIV